MSSQLQRHEATLGVPPGASMDEINNAYYFALESLGQRLTEEQEERLQKLRHSYAVLSRAHEAHGTKNPPPATPAPDPRAQFTNVGPGKSRRGAWTALAAVACLVLGGVMVVRSTAVQLKLNQFEPGTAIRVDGREGTYATVVEFDPAHRFHTGSPVAAYRLELADGTGEIWLAERVVEQAMSPVGSPGAAPGSD